MREGTMDVALVGTLPDANATAHRGPERTTIGLGEALAAGDSNVTVVADEGAPSEIDAEAHVLCDEEPPGIKRMCKFNWEVKRSGLLADADIVHTWRPLYHADVMSWHGIAMEEEVEKQFPGTFDRRRRAGAKIHRWAKTVTARRAARSIVTAPGNTEFAERYGVPVDGIVPVGVEDRFRQADAYDGSLDVLAVSRIERRKQPAFVDKQTPTDYTTTIVGGASNESYAAELSDRWEGKVSDERLRSLYRQAGVFVLPSYFEPFGLTAAEAMAAGTPIVVSETTAIADWVREHALGAVYTFDDPGSYQSALHRVLEDRGRYAENARRFVDERLRWKVIAERYEQLYQEIAE